MALLYFIPVTLLLGLLALLFWKKPRKNINLAIGYRTTRAMRSQHTWDFAQVYNAKMMFNLSIIFILAGTPVLLLLGYLFHVAVSFITAFVFIMLETFLPIYFTEKKLKQLFDKNGNPIK
ncbi:SdpI family protein [Chitinophaga niabensis]|uniref:SdpI/YhfL protein family protein n=1 Tax=Chitinophaga niabensis TaxID=536979 RepID=A0A1N6J7R4_9BACT|nr:SdpI family protein [Chitinophaga niabensis]SIO40146.1 SdpI/YhfL protein family protein [Chitinophaga niabensis]